MPPFADAFSRAIDAADADASDVTLRHAVIAAIR